MDKGNYLIVSVNAKGGKHFFHPADNVLTSMLLLDVLSSKHSTANEHFIRKHPIEMEDDSDEDEADEVGNLHSHKTCTKERSNLVNVGIIVHGVCSVNIVNGQGFKTLGLVFHEPDRMKVCCNNGGSSAEATAGEYFRDCHKQGQRQVFCAGTAVGVVLIGQIQGLGTRLTPRVCT